MKRAYILCWLTGFFIGSALCFYWHLHNAAEIGPDGLDTNLALQHLTLLLWPSSLMLFTLSGEHLLSTILIESISVITNGFIYMGVGVILIQAFRKLTANAGGSGQS